MFVGDLVARMTVGIAALALEGKAIVFMADKLITDENDLTIEREEAKAAFLPNGWVALYAGATTFADLVMSHLPVVVENNPDKVGYQQMLPAAVMEAVHRSYTDVWAWKVEQEVLKPRLMTSEQYRTGPIDPATKDLVETEKAQLESDATAEFLLCGFDITGSGHIAYVDLRHMELLGPFGAIGSGGSVADARLQWQQTRASDELARVVYEVWTAKTHAEQNAFVGPHSDAFVMYGNGQANLRVLSEPTKRLLNNVFRYNDRTPFRIARRNSERDEEVKEPEADWEHTLIRDILPLPPSLTAIRERILGADWDKR